MVTVNRDELVMHLFGTPEARGLEALRVVAREEDIQFTTRRPSIVLEVTHAGLRIVGGWRGMRHTNVLGWSMIADVGVQVLRSEIERTRRTLVDHYARIATANVPALITADFEQLVRPPAMRDFVIDTKSFAEALRPDIAIEQVDPETRCKADVPVAERE